MLQKERQLVCQLLQLHHCTDRILLLAVMVLEYGRGEIVLFFFFTLFVFLSAVGELVQQIFCMPYSRSVQIALLQEGKAVQAEDIPRDGIVPGVSLCGSSWRKQPCSESSAVGFCRPSQQRTLNSAV